LRIEEEEMVLDDRPNISRRGDPGERLDHPAIASPAVEILKVIPCRIGLEEREEFNVPLHHRLFDGRPANEAFALFGSFNCFAVASEFGGRGVRVGPRPEAQVDPLDIAVVYMLTQGDVQFHLDARLGLAMPLREAEEWLIGRMGCQSVGQLMVPGEIQACGIEALEEAGVVRVEHGVGTNLRGVGAPRPKQIHQVPAACFEGEVERREGFEVESVAIAEEQEDERVLAGYQRDFQRGGDPAASGSRPRGELQRPSRLDPVLDLVDPPLPAEAVEILKLTEGIRQR